MRFLLREQAYEKPLVAGKLVYESGRIESWRLTRALDGYRFLRADVDDRPTTGLSTLFQALIGPDGHVENLRYRMFGSEHAVRGQILRDGRTITNTRHIGRERFEEEVERDPETRIWYPAISGLTLLTGSPGTVQAVTVQAFELTDRPLADWFALQHDKLLITNDGLTWTMATAANGVYRLVWQSENGKILGGQTAAGPAEATQGIVY